MWGKEVGEDDAKNNPLIVLDEKGSSLEKQCRIKPFIFKVLIKYKPFLISDTEICEYNFLFQYRNGRKRTH